MKMTYKSLMLFWMMSIIYSVNAQSSNKELAKEKGQQAVSLMEEGKYAESITLLKEARKLDPDNLNYPYEIAYAHYAQGEYKQAQKYLQSILNHKDVNDRVYQMLGNTYDNLDKNKQAIKTYEDGLKLFPNSGRLYLELGVIQIMEKEYLKALAFFEKGINADPVFPSNYYWAAKIYCITTEEVWGMIYGEIFMNMERNSKRTSEISELLYNTYKSEIKIINDTTYSVSFCKTATVSVEDLSKSEFKLPFGVIAYENCLSLSVVPFKTINIHTLDTIRSRFIDHYFQQGNDKKYPNILFSYQKLIKDSGYMDAYNHWILMKGDEAEFVKWKSANNEKWDAFVDWFGDNRLQIDESHKFHSSQYR